MTPKVTLTATFILKSPLAVLVFRVSEQGVACACERAAHRTNVGEMRAAISQP